MQCKIYLNLLKKKILSITMRVIAFLRLLQAALTIPEITTALAAPTRKSYLITGANKGQGYALCQRILTEYDDTHVFLCSRNFERGKEAKELLVAEFGGRDRIDVVQLDVTSEESINAALSQVKSALGSDGKLAGVVSNAGILWGYSLPELMDVCATGVKRVLDAFVPIIEDDGRVVVVTSGLGPLMHSYAGEERQVELKSEDCTWEDTISPMIDECIAAYQSSNIIEDRIQAFEKIAFPGGPFAEAAPDFHMYGLSKMFGDAYMLTVSRKYPNLRVTSVDPVSTPDQSLIFLNVSVVRKL